MQKFWEFGIKHNGCSILTDYATASKIEGPILCVEKGSKRENSSLIGTNPPSKPFWGWGGGNLFSVTIRQNSGNHGKRGETSKVMARLFVEGKETVLSESTESIKSYPY